MVRQQSRTLAVVLALLLVMAQIIPAMAQTTQAAQVGDPPIRVGSKEFTEQLLLGKMFVLVLEEAGYVVDDQTGLGGSTTVRAALENDEIDLYPEYTGTALTLYNGLPTEALPNVAERAYELAKTLDQAKGLVWLDRAPLNNTFALIALADLYDEGVTTIEALADQVARAENALTICVESEFYGRADGLIGLEALYGFSFPAENILVMESDEVYTNLRAGNCAVAQGLATDGRIAAGGFRLLADTLAFFPFYQPAPVVRTELLQRYPEVAELLGSLMTLLDTPTITALNAQIDLGADGIAGSGDEAAVGDVALGFLTDNGLIKPAPIRVGSKEFTEQLLLGQLMVLLLRDAGFEVEDLTGLGGTAVIRQAVEAGEVDIYPEYTGTATSVHHDIPVTALPTTAERAYVLAKSLDAPQGLTWLNMMNFNNTYTLMVRQDLIDVGVDSIEALATYMTANETPLTLCVESEFYARPDGLDGLQALYGFTFAEENILVVETSDTYEKLRDGECDVAEGFATDGRINAWGFTNLADSLAYFPFYNPTPVVRKEVLDRHPEIKDLLNGLSTLLDEATMSELNARVDIGPDDQLASGDEESVTAVAYSFLRANRLIALPEITVSAIDDNEGFHAIMGHLLMLLLADAGYQPVDKTDLGGSILVRQAMLNGEVDLYIESIITALAEYNGLPVAALPTTRERAFALAQTLDKPNDLVWLDLLPYVETTAIVAGATLAELAITSLDDFALYMIANEAPLSICMDGSFYGSEFNGLDALEELYGFRFEPEKILLIDSADLLASLTTGQCDVAAASSIDAQARDLPVLSDPLGFFLDFGSAPVIRKEILDQNPEFVALFGSLITRLDTETSVALARLVTLGEDGVAASGDERSAYIIARDFLVDAGLIVPPTEDDNAVTEESTDAELLPEEEGIEEAPADSAVEEVPDPDSGEGTPAPADAQPADDDTEEDTGSSPAEPETPTLAQRNPQADTAMPGDRNETFVTADTQGPPAIVPPALVETNPAIAVGSMMDTEQRLIGAMLVAMLRDGGYPVVDRTATGTSPDLRTMLERGAIDLYPEFTGVALSLYHNIPPSALPTTADGAFSLVKTLDESFNIVWIRKASFDSAYGLAVSADLAVQGVRTLFSLGERLRSNSAPLAICVDEAFLADNDLGLPSIVAIYGWELAAESVVTLPSEEIYRALRDGRCDVGKVLQTDGRIGAWNLFVLEDTQGAFPNYTPAPIARRDLLTRYPELEEYLGQLGPLLNSATMTVLNAQVDLGADAEAGTGDESAVDAVALAFLCDNQLVRGCGLPLADATPLTTTINGSVSITPAPSLIPITASFTSMALVPAPARDLENTEILTGTVSATVSGSADGADAAQADSATPATLPTTEEAAAGTTSSVATPATFGVNVRATADATAEVVAILPRNTTIQATGRTADGSWLQILTLEGEVAWVFTAAIISRPEVLALLPIVVPPTLSTTP